jgi:hypothetical protein
MPILNHQFHVGSLRFLSFCASKLRAMALLGLNCWEYASDGKICSWDYAGIELLEIRWNYATELLRLCLKGL